MKTYVVAIRDAAIGTFNRPAFVPAIGAGLRSFGDEVNRVPANLGENPLNEHPEDFALWLLAVFDDEAGEFTEDEDMPRQLARAVDVKR